MGRRDAGSTLNVQEGLDTSCAVYNGDRFIFSFFRTILKTMGSDEEVRTYVRSPPPAFSWK